MKDKIAIKGKLNAFVLLSILLILLALVNAVFAIPPTLTLQGKLTNQNGAAHASTKINFTFKIYDAFTAGNVLWQDDDRNITTDANGIYDAILYNLSALNFSDQYYLGITVGDDNESAPRINLTSSPYSFRANVSEQLNRENKYEVSVLNITGNLTLGEGFDDALTITTGRFNITDGDIKTAGNLTLAERISFSLGAIIDNLVSNILKINAKLNVTGNVSIAQDTLFVDNTSGRVGIGTASPVNALTIIGDVSAFGSLNATSINASSIKVGTKDVQTVDFNIGNISNNTLVKGDNATLALWNISNGTLHPRNQFLLVRIGNINFLNISNDTFAVEGSSAFYGSLNATRINATEIFMSGGIVQSEASAFKLSNVSNYTQYQIEASAFKLGNVTLYIQDNASLIRVSNFTDLFLSNYSNEYARSGFKIANYSDAYAASGFKLGNVSNYTQYVRGSDFNIGNISNNTLVKGDNATLALWNISNGTLHPRNQFLLVRIGNINFLNISNDTFAVEGSSAFYGSLNATFINATQIFMGGSNLVQTDAPAYKRANYSDEYASTGFKVGNVTLYIQDNASLIRASNFTDLFLSNYSNEYARSGYKRANYSDEYASTGFKVANVTIYIQDNASIIRIGNFTDLFLSNYSNEYARSGFKIANYSDAYAASGFKLGNVSNDSLKITGNASTALWNASGANIFLREITGNIGVNTIRPDNRLTIIGTDADNYLDAPGIVHLNVTDSQNNTLTNIITLDHFLNNPLNATNAKAGVRGGIGLGILFRAINNESEIINVSFINATLVDAANASEAGALTFYTATPSGVESRLVPRLILNGSDVLVSPVSGNTYINPIGGRVGIGTTAPTATLGVRGGVNISGGLNVTNGDVLLAVTAGSVGIGTIFPNTKLEVNGTSTFGGNVNIPSNNLNVGGGYSSGGVTLVGTGTDKGSGQFAKDILIDGAIVAVYDVELNKSFIPTRNSFVSLGNYTNKFLNLYVDNILNNGTVTANTNMTLIGNLSFFDVNNYIYQPAADTLAFGTNQAERVRVDSSGRVGIGTKSPNDALVVVGNLMVSGSFNATEINATSINVTSLILGWTNLTSFPAACSAGQFVTQVGDTLTCSTPAPASGGGWTDDGAIVRLTTGSDLVGIGTTKADNRLTIAGNDTDAALDVPGILHINVTDSFNTTTTNIITLDHLLNNPVNASNPKGVRGGIGLGILFRAINNESEIINVSFINATLVDAANASEAGALTFYTATPSGVESRLVPRLVLNGSDVFIAPTGGRVGIGTTSPTSTLHVIGTGNFSSDLYADSVKSSLQFTLNSGGFESYWQHDATFKIVKFGGSDSTSEILQLLVGGSDKVNILKNNNVGIGTTTPGSVLSVTGNFSTTTGALLATSSGNVGIGTTAPKAKLVVIGGANISGGLNVTTGNVLLGVTSGSVGIGTTAPQNALDVVGAVTVSKGLNASNLNVTGFSITDDSLVTLSDGSKKKIKDIEAGEEVLTLDEKTGKLVPRKVNALLDHGIKPIYEMATEDGRAINTTGEHPYYVKSFLPGIVDDSKLPSSFNSIKNPSKSSGLDLDLSKTAKDSSKAEGLSCGILSQTTPNIFSFVYKDLSVKSQSLVTNILCSDLENSANLPFESPLGLDIISNPCCLRNVSNLLFTFSSLRNLGFEGDTELDIISTSSQIGSILKSCQNMFFGYSWVVIEDFINAHSSVEHLQNLPYHDSCALEGRLSMADFAVRNDVLVDFDSHTNSRDNSVFKDYGKKDRLGEWIEARYLKDGRAINTTAEHPYYVKLNNNYSSSCIDLFLDSINSDSSLVLNTLMRDCCLNAASSDHIAEFNANANAKYGSSSASSACGDILLASARNPLYASSGNDSTFFSSKEKINENASSLILPYFFILSFLPNNSLNANLGLINLDPSAGNSSIIALLPESLLKKENKIEASITRILDSSSGICTPYNPCLLAASLLSSEPHFNAKSSVILEFFSNSSATLNINLSDSLSLSALDTIAFISSLASSLDPTSSSSEISTFNSGILTSQDQYNENDYLKVLKNEGFFKYPEKQSFSLLSDKSLGEWIEVRYLKVGDDIAVPDYETGKIKWEKIASIRTLEPQHVYDLSIEGTRNFIANDIVAHNTYLATSSGNVGIGTTAPNVKLTVIGGINASGGLNVTAGDVLLAVTSGNVGIGTAGPETKLDVAGGAVLIDNNQFYSAETTAGANTIILGISSDDSTRLLSAASQPIIFRPGDSIEVMRMTTGGNVGIGTTTPDNLLTIRGSDADSYLDVPSILHLNITDSFNTTLTNIITLDHLLNNPVNASNPKGVRGGIGLGILFRAINNESEIINVSFINATLVDAANASEAGALTFYTATPSGVESRLVPRLVLNGSDVLIAPTGGVVKVGGNAVQTVNAIFGISNYSDAYASTGFKVANVTLYIQDNASLIRVSNFTDLFLSNYSNEYARSGYKRANYSDEYASTGFKVGNVTLYIQDNASLIRVSNFTDLFLSNYSNEYARSGFKLGNVSNYTQYVRSSDFNLGNISNDSLKISGNASIALWNVSGSNIFLREITGSVGIGNASPDNRLTITGTDIDANLDPTGLAHLIIKDSFNTTTTNIITLDHLLNNPENASNTKAGVTGGIGLGILFRAINNDSEIINVSFINASLVNAINGSEAGALTFYTANRSGVATRLVPRLILNGSDVFIAPTGGNVGIGTTTLALDNTAARRHLTMSGTGNGMAMLELQNPSATAGAGLGGVQFFSGTDNVGYIGVDLASGVTDAGEIVFLTQPTGGSTTQRMKIDSTGNVGIGTTTPRQELHVIGNVTINDSVTEGAIQIDSTNDAILFTGENGSMYQPVYGTDDDLILYLPFSENAVNKSNRTYDRSPYGNDGTLRNMNYGNNTNENSDNKTGWAKGKYGNAIQFDGSNDYVNTSLDDRTYDFNSSYTMSAWINPNMVVSSYFFSNWRNEDNHGIFIQHSTGSALRFVSRNLSGVQLDFSTADNAAPPGVWTYVAVTFDPSLASGNAKIYVNGVESVRSTSAKTAFGISGTGKTLLIGSLEPGQAFANITMDEVMVYKRALSPEEIRTHYLRGSGFGASGAITADKFRVVNTTGFRKLELNQSAFAVHTGGAERLKIDSSGNVGIGTTSPATILDVKGKANFTGNFSVGQTSNIFFVDNTSERVGIGTTSPQQMLHVLKTGTVFGFGSDVIAAFQDNSDTADAASIAIIGGTSGDSSINFGDGSGAGENVGWINYNHLSNFMRFYTNSGERVRIDSSGNVGIGTPGPGRVLQVNSSVRQVISVQRNAVDTGGAGIEMRNGNNHLSEIYNYFDSTIDKIHINFEGQDLFAFTNTSKMGINTTTPKHTLTVQGTLNVTSGGTPGPNLFVASNGRVGINTSSPAMTLHVAQLAEGNVFRIDDTTNTCDMDPDATVVDTCASDARLKENIRDAAPVLDYLAGIKLRDFKWIKSGEEDTGVVAQEIMEDYPDLISMNENGYYMAESISSWKLLKAIQEQQAQIDELQKKIKVLENETFSAPPAVELEQQK